MMLASAKQIAEALEAAHQQEIVHRDVKPATVKVRPDGTVKVKDFGLANAMEPAGAACRSGRSPRPSPRQKLALRATRARSSRDDGGRDPRHSDLHVARAGARQSGRQARGHQAFGCVLTAA